MTNFPDDFKTENAATLWWQDLKVSLSYKDIIYSEKTPLIFPWRMVRYRVQGQRGQLTQALVAVQFTPAEIQTRLEAHHGRSVSLTLETSLPDSTAQPEAAMPVELPPPAEPCPPIIEIDPMVEFMSVTPAPKLGEVPYLERCRFGSKDWLSVDVLGMRVFVDVDVGRPPAPGSVPTMAPA